ncbi:alpha-L-fucosidase [Pedobacter glucosidilyticus]|nr:alpha-L-fucosidase [Pedobacter glucosidilyticus]KHJ39436.1 alpha-L-fucosidase [Pedobacter glucosidilyticus]
MITNKIKFFTVFFILNISISAFAQVKPKDKGMEEMWGDTKVNTENKLLKKAKLFDEGNFGMFIHWGLFSNLGGKWQGKTYYGIGEWIMNKNMANIPVNEYKLIAKDFNPKGFDAKAIVKLAKDAGMKYIIITSKHHEGFAMFDSKVDPFNIVKATPFARDPMKELSAACKEAGLGFGFYYSHNQDWTAPGGTRGPETYPDGKPATFDDYFNKKCLPQVKEICSNYGSIDFIWFDTPGDMKREYVEKLISVVNKLQPNAMLCSRVGYGLGDYASLGDMEVPRKNISGLWETADTNNDSWSYAWYDNNFKSPKEILNRLVATVARGGTYLFNVGPNENGQIPTIGAQFLQETGEWIKKYPQVIYNAGSSPWGHALPWGDVTTKGNSLFLSVFDWPKDGKLYLPGLTEKVITAKLLSLNQSVELKHQLTNNWLIIDVPYQSADSPASVIELILDKPANEVKLSEDFGIYPNIKTSLLSNFATVSGAELKFIRWMEKFGEWKHAEQVSKWQPDGKVTWTLNVQTAGYYYLDLTYRGKGKLVWKTETDEGIILQNQQAATEKYNNYRMGIIEFKKPGKHTITVSLVEGDPQTASLEGAEISPIN